MRALTISIIFSTIISGCFGDSSQVKVNNIINENNDCYCSSDSILKDLIPCEPKILSNSAKLYWSYNCDSSWLTFENAKGKKEIIFTLRKDLLDLTTRLGHVSFIEFDSTFLYQNAVISGCCDPHDYYLYDKNSGELVNYLGKAVFVSDDNNYPFFISLSNNNDSLIVHNLNTHKAFALPFDKTIINQYMESNNLIHPEQVFGDGVLEQGTLRLQYKVDVRAARAELVYKTLIIDLYKYRS